MVSCNFNAFIDQSQNLSQAFHSSLKHIGNRTAATFLPRGEQEKAVSLSGFQLNEVALSRATQLHTLLKDIHPAKIVLLAMSPGLEFVTTFLAGIYAGLTWVIVPISSGRLQLERIKSILNDCGSDDIVCDDAGYRTLTELSIQKENLRLHRLEDKLYSPSHGEIFPGFSHNSEDSAYIQYTSGSSKAPKGVLLTHKNVIKNLAVAGLEWNFGPESISGSWLPHYHDMGLAIILTSLLHGTTIIFMSPLAFIQKPVRWLNMISNFRINISGAPPFAYNLCCKEALKKELPSTLDLSCWDRAFVGSEIVHETLLSEVRSTFQPYGLRKDALFACYGMAETNIFIAGAPHNNETFIEPLLNTPLQIAACRLTDKTINTIKIVDFETKNLLEDGQRGEIWVQSEAVGSGYVSRSEKGILKLSAETFEATSQQLKGKWLQTGDLGYRLGNNLYVLGRANDTVKVNGLNIMAADIEWYAAEVNHQLNPFGAAAFRSSEYADGKVNLLIETTGQIPAEADDIVQQIRSRIQSLFSLELEHVVLLKRGTLDRTTSGKVRRSSIARNFSVETYTGTA